jgi:hypothetical protein
MPQRRRIRLIGSRHWDDRNSRCMVLSKLGICIGVQKAYLEQVWNGTKLWTIVGYPTLFLRGCDIW